MASKINTDGMDVGELLLEVLNSESSFGQEMRNKVSSTLDVATKKIEKGINTLKFDKEPINISSVAGISDSERKKMSSQFQTQQKKLLKWIREISMASNWKQLRKGANITDILGSDKIQNERFQKEFAKLQKQMLAAIKANIPTKVDILPEVAKSKAVKPPVEVPEGEQVGDAALGIAGMKHKDVLSMPTVSNFEFEGIDNAKRDDNETFVTSIMEKLDKIVADSVKGEDAIKGREEFIEGKAQPVIITEFGKEAVDQLAKALPGKDKDGVDKIKQKMAPEKVDFLKKVLKLAGITALIGLVTYLAKNPEALEKAKTFFKEKFIPWMMDMPKHLESLGKFIFNTITGLYNAFVTAQTWMEEKFWPGVFATFEWIGEKFVATKEWFNEKVTIPLGNAFHAIWKGTKDLGAAVKKFFLAIPSFLGEQLTKLKEGFINLLKKHPLVKAIISTLEKREAKRVAEEKQYTDKREKRKRQVAGRERIEEEIGRPLTQAEGKAISDVANQRQNPESKKVFQALRLEAANAKPVEVSSGKAEDFIYRPGQPIERISSGDTVIGKKEMGSGENKNLDKQMHDLHSTMKDVDGNFKELIKVNKAIAAKGIGSQTTVRPLPAIASDISTHRDLGSDQSTLHKFKVWDILRGY